MKNLAKGERRYGIFESLKTGNRLADIGTLSI